MSDVRITSTELNDSPNGAAGTSVTVTSFEGLPADAGLPAGGTAGQVLAKASTDDYDTHWIDQAGGGGGGAVDSVNGQTGTVILAAADVGADASGAAAAAEAAANTYTDAQVAAEASRADVAYDAAGAASAAQTAAEAYTDAQLSAEVTRANAAYDAAGAAASAQSAAQAYTDTAVSGEVSARAAAITTAINNLIDSAPGTLDTLNELATALGDDPSFATTVTTALAGKQPLDSDLTAIAALSTTTYGRSLLALADAAALRVAAGLGSAATASTGDFDAAGAAAAAQAASQPLDSDLTAIAALTTTSYGRAFLALADAAAGRTALGLGTAATANTGTGASNVILGNDSRLADSRTPSAHATTHGNAGTDRVALDASQVTSGQFAIARLASGTPDGTKFVRDDGTLATPSGGGGGSTIPTNYLAPSGASYETYFRQVSSGSISNLVSGSLHLVAIALPSGLTIGTLSFMNLRSIVSPTHWWFGLYNSSRVQLAVTADQTTTAWSANVIKSLPIATTASGAASSFTTTYTGLHYLGIMMTASTTAQLDCAVQAAGAATPQPAIYGTSTTGLTAPPSFPFTAANPSWLSQFPYAFVGA